MRTSRLLTLLILAAAFALSAWVYGRLPERVITHWDAAGQPNGYSSRFMGAYLVPFIMCFVAVLMEVLPRIDPMRGNVAQFRDVYEGVTVAVLVFLLSIHGMAMAMNLGARVDMGRFLAVAVAALFFYLGRVIGKVKQNWFLGIRTPWTMSSPEVWEKTHRMGAKLFQGAAAVILLGAMFPRQAIWFVLAPTFGITLYLIYYSWREAEREITGK